LIFRLRYRYGDRINLFLNVEFVFIGNSPDRNTADISIGMRFNANLLMDIKNVTMHPAIMRRNPV